MTVANGIQRVYVVINGVETDISEGTPLEIINIDNLGASEVTRITERGPMQDGDSDVDQVLEARIIPIIIQARISTTYPAQVCRRAINELFKGTNLTIGLTVVFDDGTTYRIDTKSLGNINLPLNPTVSQYIKVGIQLRAANPTFYNPVLTTLDFGISGAGETQIPMTVATLVGGSTLDQTIVANYDGTYHAYPIIYIYGPVTNPVITNTTTGQKLDFTGITINNGDHYTIDLRYGRKIVYKNDVLSDNRINELTTDSNIATFAIEADPIVSGGVNTIHVTGSTITGVTRYYVQYNERYDGI